MRRIMNSAASGRYLKSSIRYNSNLSKKIKDGSDAALNSISSSKMVLDFKELWTEAERRRYNTRWIGVGCAATVVYIFYGIITDWLSDQAADVTSKYLDNPKFKKDIIKFSEDAVAELVKSERVQKDIAELLGSTVIKLSEDPKIREKLTEMFIDIFKNEEIKNAGANLSNDVLVQLLESDKYNDIREKAVQLVIDEMINIVNNDELQKNVGVASWNAFKVWFGMTPTNSDNKT